MQEDKELELCKLVFKNEANEEQLNEYYKLDEKLRIFLEKAVKHSEFLKDKRKEKRKAYAEKRKEYVSKYQEKHPEVVLYHSAKHSAKRHDTEFTITKQDIKIPEFCPYLGYILTVERGEGRNKNSASLSRIDKTKGFIPGNIEVISDLAARMKQEANPQELISFARSILKRYGIA